MGRLMILIATVAWIGLLPAHAFAGSDQGALEQLVIEMANTPQEHQALAQYYRAQALSKREDAERHKNMAQWYSSGNVASRSAMKKHCDNIAALDEKMAAEYDAMAKVHEEQAKKK